MKQWYLIIDVSKCSDCNNCFLACKDEFVDNDFPGYTVAQPRKGHRWINIMHKERGQHPMVDVAYLPVPCMHCENPPCAKRGEHEGVHVRNDGVVIIDPERTRGQKEIVHACPYGAIWWNDDKKVPQKCILCVHLLDDGWKEPRCVQACPTGALRAVRTTISEMEKIVKEESLEIYQAGYETKPHVFYKNLYRYLKCFIGGSVVVREKGLEECAEGANVTLIKNMKEIDETVTDNYGDFKFDNLDENSGEYALEITYEGLEKVTMMVDLETSVYVGSIIL